MDEKLPQRIKRYASQISLRTVTRATSPGVVMPATTFPIPSSRRRSIPERIAASRIPFRDVPKYGGRTKGLRAAPAMNDLVDIFNFTEPESVATLAQQREFYPRWNRDGQR
jgi:hypothetical protein